MEPLLILLLTPRPVYHICRGDIFENPKIARILTFLKIFPIFRRRDGMASLQRNEETFDKSRKVLVDGFPLSMMAEGQHTDRHQLLPLVKGMFRIAGSAQQQMGDKPLFIVPLGIDLDDYERPYSHAVLQVGEPIDVRPYMNLFTTDEPQALNEMRYELTRRLKAVMHNIDSRDHYLQFEALCNLLNPQERRHLNLRNTPFNRFLCRQQIAHRLDTLEQRARTAAHLHTPTENLVAQELEKQLHLADQTIAWCKQHHRRLKTIAEPMPLTYRLGRIALLLAVAAACISVPILRHVLLFLLLAYPLPFIPTHLIVRRLIDDTQFRSSINFGVRLALFVVYTLVFALVIGIIKGPLWALLSIATAVVAARIAPKVFDWCRRTVGLG